MKRLNELVELDFLGIHRDRGAVGAILATSQGLRLTRMNLPYLPGSVVTHDRDRARLYGVFVHIVNGWLFSIFYILIFEDRHLVSWWLDC